MRLFLEAKVSPKAGALSFKQDGVHINGLLSHGLYLSEHIKGE